MNFTDNSKALYQQIADRISDRVLSGALRPEDRVPSVRESAGEMQVNANTVMRAYDLLSQQGIIYNKRGVGYFIADDAPRLVRRMRASTVLGTEMTAFFDAISAMGVTPDSLLNYYTEYLRRK